MFLLDRWIFLMFLRLLCWMADFLWIGVNFVHQGIFVVFTCFLSFLYQLTPIHHRLHFILQ